MLINTLLNTMCWTFVHVFVYACVSVWKHMCVCVSSSCHLIHPSGQVAHPLCSPHSSTFPGPCGPRVQGCRVFPWCWGDRVTPFATSMIEWELKGWDRELSRGREDERRCLKVAIIMANPGLKFVLLKLVSFQQGLTKNVYFQNSNGLQYIITWIWRNLCLFKPKINIGLLWSVSPQSVWTIKCTKHLKNKKVTLAYIVFSLILPVVTSSRYLLHMAKIYYWHTDPYECLLGRRSVQSWQRQETLESPYCKAMLPSLHATCFF